MTLNTTAAVAATTTLAVNGSRLLQVFRDAFTKPTTFVSELAQNARRSGSSCVVIDFDDQQHTFSIEDTGSGISDWDALMNIGTSGWDMETIDKESAFGIGALSMVYAAKHIRIESSTGTLDASTEDILQMKPLSITAAVRDKGTKITLTGIKPELGDKPHHRTSFIRTLFEAFPIPVIVNGEELLRPYSLDSLRTCDDLVESQTDLGPLFTPKAKLSKGVTLYLQGFAVAGKEYGFGSSQDTRYGNSYLHITDPTVRARCPDRDQLVELDNVMTRLKASVLEADRLILRQWADSKDFHLLYHCVDRLKQAGELHLLNAADWMPNTFVSDFDSPHMRQYGGAGFERDSDGSLVGSVVTREEVENGDIKLFDVPVVSDIIHDEERHHELLVIGAYLLALKGVHAEDHISELDEGHWARKHLIPFSPFDEDDNLLLTVSDADITAKGDLPFDSNTYTHAALANSVCIDGSLGKVQITEGLVPLDEGNRVYTMLCLREKPSAYELCNYYWDDRWNDTSEDLDNDKLYRFFAALEAGNATNLIKQQLQDITSTLKSFGEGEFRVIVTQQGIEVEQIKAKAKKTRKSKTAKS